MFVIFNVAYVLGLILPIPDTDNIILSSSDINECNIDSPCHANATCNNTEGSYICECNIGFTGDGFTCDGIYVNVYQFFNVLPKLSHKALNTVDNAQRNEMVTPVASPSR